MSDRPLLVFDVNETLLDLEFVAPQFDRMFGDVKVLREWFAQMILYSQALTLAGAYAPFGELGGAVLKMVGAVRGQEITDDDVAKVKDAVANMPPHPDVAPELRRLRDAGFRLFTLTNNPNATALHQLEHAGIAELFERKFSIDDGVRRYKPAPETYAAVSAALATPASQLCLIACHTWDTLGASAAGWQSALVLRNGNAPLAVGTQPDYIGTTLTEIADALLARHPQA